MPPSIALDRELFISRDGHPTSFRAKSGRAGPVLHDTWTGLVLPLSPQGSLVGGTPGFRRLCDEIQAVMSRLGPLLSTRLADEEIDEEDAGRALYGLCAHVPDQVQEALDRMDAGRARSVIRVMVGQAISQSISMPRKGWTEVVRRLDASDPSVASNLEQAPFDRGFLLAALRADRRDLYQGHAGKMQNRDSHAHAMDILMADDVEDLARKALAWRPWGLLINSMAFAGGEYFAKIPALPPQLSRVLTGCTIEQREELRRTLRMIHDQGLFVLPWVDQFEALLAQRARLEQPPRMAPVICAP